MAKATVGRWGKNLAVRLPGDVARAAGIKSGEQVEIEARDGDIVLRRATDKAAAEAAADEILKERERHDLGGISIRELLEEGRRG